MRPIIESIFNFLISFSLSFNSSGSRALYPKSLMIFLNLFILINLGSYSIVASSVEKLTTTFFMPFCFFNSFSIIIAQLAQCIPCMDKVVFFVIPITEYFTLFEVWYILQFLYFYIYLLLYLLYIVGILYQIYLS